MNQDDLSRVQKNKQQKGNFLFSSLVVYSERTNQWNKKTVRHCGIFKQRVEALISREDADETKNLKCFWQLNSNSEYWIWIFLTVVLTLLIHIKTLGEDVICNYGSFCRNNSLYPFAISFFFESYCVLTKVKSLQRIFYRDVNQWSDRVETPGRGNFNLINTQKCGSCSKYEGTEMKNKTHSIVCYLITWSWLTTRLS